MSRDNALHPCSLLRCSAGDSPAAAGAAGSAALAWNDVCQWVLGRPAPLWPLLFEQPLVERAKQLVTQHFSAVVDEVATQLGGALEAAAGLPPSAPGSYQAGSWSGLVHLAPATPDATAAGGPAARCGGKRRRRGRSGAAATGLGGEGDAAQRWLQSAEHIVRHFDHQLGDALEAALDACGSGSGGSGDGAAAGRALILEPFVQDR